MFRTSTTSASHAADRKQVVVDELSERGVLFEALSEVVGKDLDPFDMILGK